MKHPGLGLALGLAFSLFAVGCASYARRLERSTVAQIRPGQTSRSEAEQLLGPPRGVMMATNGVVTRHFFYGYRPSTDASGHQRRWHPGDVIFRTLTLKFGPMGVVEQKVHDESVTPVYRTNAWFFAGPDLSPHSLDFLVRGVTTEAELIQRLGEPGSRTFDSEGRPEIVWYSIRVREKAWPKPPVQTLAVRLEGGVARDYTLFEQTAGAPSKSVKLR